MDMFSRVGDSGLKVSKLICGTMKFGSKKYFSEQDKQTVVDDPKVVNAILNECYSAGIRTFDTADVYSGGQSEQLIGQWMQDENIPRGNVILMTKVFGFVEDKYGIKENHLKRNPLDKNNNQGLSRKHIIEAVDASLKRLQTDYIDILQIHRFDYETSIAETMRALNDVVNQGKVRYIGCSSMKAYQFIKMQNYAESKGWHKFISMQNYYNLIYREDERELIPYCEEESIGLMPWAPLAQGHLTRSLGNGDGDTDKEKVSWFSENILGIDLTDEATKAIISALSEVAQQRETSMAVIALAWLINKGCCPVVGINKVERVQELVKAVEIVLTEEEIEKLEHKYLPRLNNLLN